MERIMVKSEMSNEEEILLFYVDENGEAEQGMVTAVEGMEEVSENSIQHIYIQETPMDQDDEALVQEEPQGDPYTWSQFETHRLITFFTDNKETFFSGVTKRQFLWSVACRTMLTAKNPDMCESKLQELKQQYAKCILDQHNNIPVTWQYFELSHQAFHDDEYVREIINTSLEEKKSEVVLVEAPREEKKLSYRVVDEKMCAMLSKYLKLKQGVNKEFFQKGLWENIALQMGAESAEYWHRKFLNFKHNYIRLIEKRKANGPESVNWPYMQIFDQIFENDEEFAKKYKSESKIAKIADVKPVFETTVRDPNVWTETEEIIFAKHYFDCYDEFLDPTIPNDFLWMEVARLLEKTAEICKNKHQKMYNAHIEKYLSGDYKLLNRKTLDLIYDHIIAKDTELEIADLPTNKSTSEVWKTQEVDDLAQFFYDYTELFKDKVCYFVCWSAVTKKLKRSLQSCRSQWQDLVTLYTNILEDKKENPDMQIDWRYIELFDRLYDYGMDTKLLQGYEKVLEQSNKGGTKNIKPEPVDAELNGMSEDEYNNKTYSTRSGRATGDAKAFKILDYYLKNKELFSTSKKKTLWDVLGKQIGMNGTQCAHRFRNFKQVYTGYVQREIDKPDKPITWPYYQHCKKVFGYRALKNKLKNNKQAFEETLEWSPKEIKQLIKYFAEHYHQVNENPTDVGLWSELSEDLKKSVSACRDKFLELRKSYRKLRTMKNKNPSVKVTWKYFSTFDDIFNSETVEVPCDFEGLNEYEELNVDEDIKQDIQDDDDIQCIIVIPEGQDLSDLSNAQIITTGNANAVNVKESNDNNDIITENNVPNKPTNTWTKKDKKLLLIHYIKYIRSHKDHEIDAKAMWKELSSKINKSPVSCRKMFNRLKNNHLNKSEENKFKSTLLEKVVKLKPNFKHRDNIILESNDVQTYKDVELPNKKVEEALKIYLENLEEFVSPRFDKNYAYSNIAETINEPVSKVYNKISFLINCVENNEFSDLIKQIRDKEAFVIANDNSKAINESNYDDNVKWSDDEKEQLLIWYLANLEKFKNPKYVRKYLWLEASSILEKSPLSCSKTMTEIRTEYRNMVRDDSNGLSDWRFYDLCQKIYGTGKQKE